MPVTDPAAQSQPDPGTGPVPLLKSCCQTAFSRLVLITQACHAILNTVFIAPTPKPAWFDDLQSKIDDAKAAANNWITNIAPGVTGGVPVQVINYGTTYSAVSASIQSIVEQYPDAQGADDPHVAQARDLVANLDQTLQTIVPDCAAAMASLTSLGNRLQAARNAIASVVGDSPEAGDQVAAALAAVDQAVRSVTAAVGYLGDYAAAWAGMGAQLVEVSEELQPEVIKLGVAVESAFSQAAAEEWADLVTFAEHLMDTPMPDPVGPAAPQGSLNPT